MRMDTRKIGSMVTIVAKTKGKKGDLNCPEVYLLSFSVS